MTLSCRTRRLSALLSNGKAGMTEWESTRKGRLRSGSTSAAKLLGGRETARHHVLRRPHLVREKMPSMRHHPSSSHWDISLLRFMVMSLGSAFQVWTTCQHRPLGAKGSGAAGTRSSADIVVETDHLVLGRPENLSGRSSGWANSRSGSFILDMASTNVRRLRSAPAHGGAWAKRPDLLTPSLHRSLLLDEVVHVALGNFGIRLCTWPNSCAPRGHSRPGPRDVNHQCHRASRW